MQTRARVTARTESDPDHRGRRRLLAPEGAIVTVDEARRLGIPEEVLEPVGPDARVSTTSTVIPIGPTPDDVTPDEGPESTDTPPPDGDGDADGDGGDPFPRHQGGPNWLLSDGSKKRGSREDAEQAERELAAARVARGNPEGHHDAREVAGDGDQGDTPDDAEGGS